MAPSDVTPAEAPLKKLRAFPTPKAKPRPVPMEESSLWISRNHNIPGDRLNGWVVSWILESYLKEDVVVKACEKASLKERLEACGLTGLEAHSVGPRKRCQILKSATDIKHEILAEVGQRHMLASISE